MTSTTRRGFLGWLGAALALPAALRRVRTAPAPPQGAEVWIPDTGPVFLGQDGIYQSMRVHRAYCRGDVVCSPQGAFIGVAASDIDEDHWGLVQIGGRMETRATFTFQRP